MNVPVSVVLLYLVMVILRSRMQQMFIHVPASGSYQELLQSAISTLN